MEEKMPDYRRINNKFINSTVEIEKVVNVASSTAGAGSGDFHHYRSQRRKERYRIAKMEFDARQREEKEAEDKKKQELKDAQELAAKKKTSKRKYRKLKAKQLKNARKLNAFADDGSFMQQFASQNASSSPLPISCPSNPPGHSEASTTQTPSVQPPVVSSPDLIPAPALSSEPVAASNLVQEACQEAGKAHIVPPASEPASGTKEATSVLCPSEKDKAADTIVSESGTVATVVTAKASEGLLPQTTATTQTLGHIAPDATANTPNDQVPKS